MDPTDQSTFFENVITLRNSTNPDFESRVFQQKREIKKNPAELFCSEIKPPIFPVTIAKLPFMNKGLAPLGSSIFEDQNFPANQVKRLNQYDGKTPIRGIYSPIVKDTKSIRIKSPFYNNKSVNKHSLTTEPSSKKRKAIRLNDQE